MKRPYDDADDLQEREIYLRDRGVDHEEKTHTWRRQLSPVCVCEDCAPELHPRPSMW